MEAHEISRSISWFSSSILLYIIILIEPHESHIASHGSVQAHCYIYEEVILVCT